MFGPRSPELMAAWTLYLVRSRLLLTEARRHGAGKSSLFQPPSQGHFGDGLKQSGTKVWIQINRTVHDDGFYLVFMHLRVFVAP